MDRTGNDGTIRRAIWRRLEGDEWAAFDSLPGGLRARLCEHAYDAWAVNALWIRQHFRRLHRREAIAERAAVRYLDHCERLERRAFAERWAARFGTRLPHDAAALPVLRSGPVRRPGR